MSAIWHTGTGKKVLVADMMDIIKKHVDNNGSIYIGTDSCVDKNRCVFATAICLHGANEQSGGKYFFRRVFFKRKKFSSLVHRISHEVQQSIELALLLSEDIPPTKIELHIDISPANKGHGTSKFADMLTGYARASGFEYKIKPDAWASQSVADKHSK